MKTKIIRIEVSSPAFKMLEKLRATGLHGETVRDVAARLIDEKLIEMKDYIVRI